ncbi:helix-turn-helix domain-containing protein [Cupriavidus alkaliphilus]|uniref:helix-turn-helix domain-containing protein n=1 Tax=Cupriavidus alkaliphilus TaxID=942866 RepID=UPI001612BA9D|nr:AraC family transcriptional regulator [Cupriavidus alkaliphilus]MBB2917078.1 AraC family transcriptional regulator [Cupriavidus alkaliphilus]
MDSSDHGKHPKQGVESWVQLAKPTLSDSLEVTRYKGGDSEIESFLDSKLCISLVLKAPLRGENRQQGRSWQRTASVGGGIVYLPRDHSAQYWWTGASEAINVMVDADWLRARSSAEARLLPDRPIYGLRDPILAQLVQYLFKENVEGSPHGAAYSEYLALAAISRLGPLMSRRSLENKAVRGEFLVARALDYIHANLDSNLSVREIIDACEFEGDLFAFTRLFKRYCGTAPHRYILDARLERAKKLLLLADRRMTVTQVALMCGFVNLSHFSSAFKSKWGIQPSRILGV